MHTPTKKWETLEETIAKFDPKQVEVISKYFGQEKKVDCGVSKKRKDETLLLKDHQMKGGAFC